MEKFAFTPALESKHVNLSPQVKIEIRPGALFGFYCLTAPFLDLVLDLRKERNSFYEELKIQGRQLIYTNLKPRPCGCKILK